MKKINALALSTITAFALIGCGGGGSSGGSSSSSTAGTITPTTPVITTQTLSFIDDKVSGIKYVNGTASGFTDANGNFPYTSGTVEFYLGDIKLGSLSSIPTDKNVFIQDILGIDRTDTSNAKVLKIASLLQSLDSNTSTDEIEIKEEDFNKFKNQSITSIDENSDIQTLLTNLNFTKVSDENTKRHLDNSLKYYGVVSDTTAPTLLSSSILNGAINVSKDANIVLSFSDDIRKNLIKKENISLVDASNSVVDFTLSHNFNVITITPLSLSYATTYNLTLKSTIEDYGKNSLGTTDTTISFTTQAQPDTNAPTITSASTFSVNENQNSAFTITATDTSAISYSIEGTDKDLFNINSNTGIVTFKSNPDYESSSHTPSYSLIVKVTDSSNNSSTQTVSITILNVDETIPDTTPPVITSASTFSVLENQTGAFTVTATDDSNTTITYSISGGTDASAFSINSSGAVTFNTAPDYEIKTSYSVTVKATDSSNNFSTKAVTVNITDVLEGSGVFKTGQTTSYATGDDGYYASTLGVARSFTRDTTKEIVTDNITKLQWQDDATASTTTADWTTATTSTCQNLTLGGYSDWRLPTIEELESIVNYGASAPAKYSEFINFASYFYWSSTTRASGSSNAYDVDFSYGDVSDYLSGKTNSLYVRCVRAGQ